MKVVFPTCCGVDVHKTFVVATIITTSADSLQPHYQKKRFSTFNSDLNRFADWLLEHNCLDVCMESTGKYWVPVFNILEKRGVRIVMPCTEKSIKRASSIIELLPVKRTMKKYKIFSASSASCWPLFMQQGKDCASQRA